MFHPVFSQLCHSKRSVALSDLDGLYIALSEPKNLALWESAKLWTFSSVFCYYLSCRSKCNSAWYFFEIIPLREGWWTILSLYTGFVFCDQSCLICGFSQTNQWTLDLGPSISSAVLVMISLKEAHLFMPSLDGFKHSWNFLSNVWWNRSK